MVADSGQVLRADARRNAERLVEVATEVFAEQGPDAPLSEIARAAGVGTATLYRRFPTRGALLAAVYAGHVTALASRAEELAEVEGDPVQALVAWLYELADLLSQQRGMKALITRSYEGDLALFEDCRRSLTVAVDTLLGPAHAAGRIRREVDAERTLTVVNALVLVSDQIGGGQEQNRQLIDLVMSGFRLRCAD